jgi:GntR family transcriptional regulator
MHTKKTPRYRSIADGLINAIVSKQYRVGTSLPAEAELCTTLQASRHTVREALRILEEAGLISRRQGSGSEVVADTPPVRYRQTVDTIEDLLQYGERSRLQLLSSREVAVNSSLAARLMCPTGTACIELRSLRSERGEKGQPFALTHIHFPPQPPKKRDKLLHAPSALATMLAALDARTLGRIEQVFEAVALDAESAKLLNTSKGDPAFRSDRAYFDRKGSLILLAVTLHRSDLFRYATVLRHESS